MKLQGPDGKCLYGFVKVGAKGQIVIPKEARDDYGIKPGDQLAVGGGEGGVAIMTDAKLNEFFRGIIAGEEKK